MFILREMLPLLWCGIMSRLVAALCPVKLRCNPLCTGFESTFACCNNLKLFWKRGYAITAFSCSLLYARCCMLVAVCSLLLTLVQFVASDAFLWTHLWGSAFNVAQAFIPQTDGELMSKFFNTLIPGKDWVSGCACCAC